MYLKVIDIKKYKREVNTNFEYVSKDLLMINITFKCIDYVIPSYWRLTDVYNIPPLEIGINDKSGEIENITFFVNKIFLNNNGNTTNNKKGTVKVETNIFRKVNDFVDINSCYYVDLNANSLNCMFEEIDSDEIQSIQNDRLKVYINKLSEIIGFSITELSSDDMQKLEILIATR